MNMESIVAKVAGCSDLELATLLCLIAKQHCVIETEEDILNDLSQELALIASDIFKISYAVLSLDDYESTEAFSNAVLDQKSCYSESPNESATKASNVHTGSQYRFNSLATDVESPSRSGEANLDTRKLVNVVIAKDFNLAPEGIQIQGLELIRRKRIFSRTTIHTAPEVFLFLPLIARFPGGPRLNKHLVDRIFISHYHHPEDGMPNLEEIEVEAQSHHQSSDSSILRSSVPMQDIDRDSRCFGSEDVDKLRQMGQSTTICAEVRRYLQNIVVFLRLERGVAGGVSPYATSQFELLTKYLAPLHGLDYVTPSLVALAARKIYPHRLLLSSAEKERSMQYGSDVEAVRDALEGLSPDDINEAVLNSVECPL